MPRSQNNEIAGGFTHYRLIGVDEVVGNASTGADTVTIAALPVPKGGVVKDVALYGVERWRDAVAGTITTLNVKAGDGSDDDGFVAAYDYYETNASTGVTKWNDGAYFIGTDSAGATTSNVVNGKIYAAADTIDVTFVGSADLNTLSDGKLFVGANILDPSVYNPS